MTRKVEQELEEEFEEDNIDYSDFIDDDDEYEEDVEARAPQTVYVEDAWAEDD